MSSLPRPFRSRSSPFRTSLHSATKSEPHFPPPPFPHRCPTERTLIRSLVPSFARLHHIFSELLALADGSYVISRRSPSSDVIVFRSIPEEEFKAATAPETVVDLHEQQKNAGLTEKAIFTFVPPRWQEASGRIPNTFPPRSMPITRTSSSIVTISEELVAPLKPGERFCHTFALKGTCTKQDCRYPHRQILDEDRKKLIQQQKDSQKRKKEKKGQQKQQQSKRKKQGEEKPGDEYEVRSVQALPPQDTPTQYKSTESV